MNLRWLQQHNVAAGALAEIPEAKVRQFAAEARALDLASMNDLPERKRLTLAAALTRSKAVGGGALDPERSTRKNLRRRESLPPPNYRLRLVSIGMLRPRPEDCAGCPTTRPGGQRQRLTRRPACGLSAPKTSSCAPRWSGSGPPCASSTPTRRWCRPTGRRQSRTWGTLPNLMELRAAENHDAPDYAEEMRAAARLVRTLAPG